MLNYQRICKPYQPHPTSVCCDMLQVRRGNCTFVTKVVSSEADARRVTVLPGPASCISLDQISAHMMCFDLNFVAMDVSDGASGGIPTYRPRLEMPKQQALRLGSSHRMRLLWLYRPQQDLGSWATLPEAF